MSELPSFEKRLTCASPTISIGKDSSNDIFIKDNLVSRQHCILELDAERGGIFVIDYVNESINETIVATNFS